MNFRTNGGFLPKCALMTLESRPLLSSNMVMVEEKNKARKKVSIFKRGK